MALRPLVSLQGGRLAQRSAPLNWRQSEKSALAASLLAPSLGANVFEADLAGLMENVGLVVAMRIVDRHSADEALPWSDPFIAGLFQHARQLSAQIAAQWDFPDGVVEAIAGAGREDAGASAQAPSLGGRLGKLQASPRSRLTAGPSFDPTISPSLAPASETKCRIAVAKYYRQSPERMK